MKTTNTVNFVNPKPNFDTMRSASALVANKRMPDVNKLVELVKENKRIEAELKDSQEHAIVSC